ncbi:MAG: DUF2225 domain-containing protein [Lachnospiraceae bacterium]|nr:DUF2225 domain-containing protein [Lachnospiraceae bacterium]
MDNMFEGLEKLGLSGLKDDDLFQAPEEKTKSDSTKKAEPAKKEEKDILYDKTYKCPICENEFKARTVKVGKAKLKSADMDLRPVYQDFDVLKYDAIVCDACGYASLTRYYGPMGSAQEKLIRENICKSFKGINNDIEVFTYDDALVRHQLALANAMVRKAKSSEKAYILLKMGWLVRGKRALRESEGADKKELDELAKMEDGFLSKAYVGFSDAMSKENFPIAGMDEAKFTLLCAELARRNKDYPVAKKLISQILTSKSFPSNIKERTRDLFEVLKEECKE